MAEPDDDGRIDLARILAEAGMPPPSSAPADRGSPGRTHVFVLDDVVVKFDVSSRDSAGSMVRERTALELLGSAGLPVPRVLHRGALPDGRGWLVLSRLDGVVPTDAARPAHELAPSLAAQLGAIVARVHAVGAAPAFGTWELRPERTFAVEHWRRVAVLERMARDAGVVPAAELEALLALMRTTGATVLDGVVAPVLAHRDVQPRNVLVSPTSGEVTALLDFESSAGGDPAEDFRVLGLDWTMPGFAAFADAHRAAGGDLGPTGPDRVAHYVLEWALAVFAYLGRIAPAYLEPARAAIERVRAGARPSL